MAFQVAPDKGRSRRCRLDGMCGWGFSGYRVLRGNGSMGVVYTDHGRHLESKMAQRLAVQYALETGMAVR